MESQIQATVSQIDTSFVDALIAFSSDYLTGFMVLVFFGGIAFRGLVYFTIKREYWFTREFEKRLNAFLSSPESAGIHSFFMSTKRLMEKTYYEIFKMRSIMKRRKMDHIADPMDRAFLIQHGSAWLVRDTLKQTRYLKWNNEHPKFLEISKSVFKNNPCFNKVFGIIPITGINDILNILPGLFIVGGIFGTFLGITKALPELQAMDITNPEATKEVMKEFLARIAFAMHTSIVGIMLSVAMTLINAILSPEKVFAHTVEKFEMALSNLWQRCDSNELPGGVKDFDEHKDSLEALAEMEVRKELNSKGGRFGDLESDLDYGNLSGNAGGSEDSGSKPGSQVA